MQMKIRKLIRVLLDGFRYWKCWPHEICHYLAARMLGLRAKIGPCVTRFGPCSRRQLAVVVLAPALAGILPFVVCLWQLPLAVPGLRPVWALMSLTWVAWFITCGYDFRDVWKVLTSHHQQYPLPTRPPPIDHYRPGFGSDIKDYMKPSDQQPPI